MQSELNANQKKTGPTSDSSLQFLIVPEPWLRIFLRNVGDSFRSEPPAIFLTSKPGEYWADALVYRPAPWSAIGDSFLTHVLAVVAIFGLTLLYLNQPQVLPDQTAETRHITNYQASEYLPPVSKKNPELPKRRIAQKADPAYAPQEIISVHVNHQSIRQTIVNPVSPKLLAQDTPLPNILVWTPVPSIAPVASNHPLRQLPLTTPEVVPPVEQPAQRKLNALEFPVRPQVVTPPETPATRNMKAVNLPAEQQAAVPPSENATQRRLGDINLAMNAPTIDAPKLQAPEQQVANGQQSAQPAPAPAPVPPAEPVVHGTGKSQAREVGQLLVLNVQPVAPAGPVTVPEGNRQGEFAAGPTGRPDASGRPEIAAGASGKESPSGNKNGNNSLPNNIFISPPPTKVSAPVVVSAPVSPAPPARPDIHDTGPRNVNGPDKIETQVFGSRKYYSMALNMPNLTSATGASWIIRFAEMNPEPGSAGDGVSAPVALSKVDPAYPATLMRDRIEGTVILYAVIHSDGSVGDVKVLQGVDDTLDENARDALRKWHFRPGTKNGSPVDLEAVVKIPFRAPRKVF